MTRLVAIAMRGWLFMAALVLGAAAACAQESPKEIGYFYGRFVGGAEIQGDSASPARRESEVEIAPTDNGFQITWTTLSLDPSMIGGIKVKTAVEKFVRTDNPALFRSDEPNDPFNSQPLTWASISGNTLMMTTLTIWPDGTHDLATWSRTVMGDRMTLVFTRVQNGELVRRVEGNLLKIDAMEEDR